MVLCMLKSQMPVLLALDLMIHFGWTLFDLNIIHDEHKDDPVAVLKADFVSFTFFFSYPN